MQVITSLDYYLLPIYLILSFIMVYSLREKLNPDKSTYKIYYIAFTLKVGGGLAFALIAQYYYGFGDTLVYFDATKTFHDHIIHDPSNLKYFFASAEQYENLTDKALVGNYFIIDASALVVIKFATIFSFISFNTYLNTTLFFVILSFSGMWAIFKVFITLYPDLKKQFAWGILYLPSVIFWSSGLMKDSLTIAATGWLFYSFYQYFVFKDKKLVYLLLAAVSIYLMYVIKIYIIATIGITFIVVGVLYMLLILRPLSLRITIISAISITLIILYSTENIISDYISSFSLESIVDKISTFQSLYERNNTVNEGNFDIGTLNPTLSGIISKIPVAIGTVLYRPFLWESKNMIMIFSGLENFILMALSIYVIFRAGFINFFKIISKQSLIQYCLFFTLIFCMLVGLTTFNFGTMIRYKAPCMPFYTSFLILINYYTSLNKRNKLFTNSFVNVSSRRSRRVHT